MKHEGVKIELVKLEGVKIMYRFKVEIPPNFTQKEFKNKLEEIGIENIIELNLNYNKFIKKVPCIPNLKKLECNLSNVKSITYMKNLEELSCILCKHITYLKNFPKLRVLIFNYNNMINFPLYKNLEELYIIGCTNVVSILSFPKLKILRCFNTDIRYIPYLPNLEVLNCENTNISYLHYYSHLKYLNCIDCPFLVDNPNLSNKKCFIYKSCYKYFSIS